MIHLRSRSIRYTPAYSLHAGPIRYTERAIRYTETFISYTETSIRYTEFPGKLTPRTTKKRHLPSYFPESGVFTPFMGKVQYNNKKSPRQLYQS